jgi:hypothetical protein
MSDTPITETITNAFKKTLVSAKIERFKWYIGTFMVFSSIASISCAYFSYNNLSIFSETKKQIDYLTQHVSLMLDINKNMNEKIKKLENTISILDFKLNIILDNQNLILHKLEMVIKDTSDSNSILDKNDTPISLTHLNIQTNHEETSQTDNANKNNHDDDELLNECYDSIPMNNAKKNTTISWLFS